MTERVLIADDHPIFRHGLRDVIQGHGNFRVVAEAEDGPQALQLLREFRPTLAVLDIGLPGADGLDVLAQAVRWPDAPRFVILTLYDDPGYVRRALELGALGYLLKENAEQDLIRCLIRVSRGQVFFGSGLALPKTDGAQHLVFDPLQALSAAELRVLRLVADYKSSRQIAELLHISPRTVENHRANMVHKLGLKGSNALLRFARKHRKGLAI